MRRPGGYDRLPTVSGWSTGKSVKGVRLVMTTKKGWLMKHSTRSNLLSSLLRQEQKRFITLDANGILSWYLSEQQAARGEAKGSMMARGCTLIRVNKTNFTVVGIGIPSPLGQTRLPLHAESPEVCKEWLDALSQWATAADGPVWDDLPSGKGWNTFVVRRRPARSGPFTIDDVNSPIVRA